MRAQYRDQPTPSGDITGMSAFGGAARPSDGERIWRPRDRKVAAESVNRAVTQPKPLDWFTEGDQSK
jgi:hypothetical protein